MISKLDVLILVLVVIYLAAVGWYIWGIVSNKRRREAAKHTAHRSKEELPRNTGAVAVSSVGDGSSPPSDPGASSASSAVPASKPSSRRRHNRDGRRCPHCQQMIDRRRTTCHHCGHELEALPGVEPHPDEIKSGKSKPQPVENKPEN